MMTDEEKAKIWAMIRKRMAERAAQADETEKQRLLGRVVRWVKGDKNDNA